MPASLSLNYRVFEDWNTPDTPPGFPRPGQIRLYIDKSTGKLNIIDSDGNPALAGAGISSLTTSASFAGDGSLANPLALKSQIFNVKDYGAKGDGIIIGNSVGVSVICSPEGHSIVPTTCTFSGLPAGVSFSQADVGKYMTGVDNVNRLFISGVITSVVSPTVVIIEGFGNSDPSWVTWGTIDDAAFQACSAAVNAAVASNADAIGPIQKNAIFYIPAGVYVASNIATLGFVNVTSTPPGNQRKGQLQVIGEGSNFSILTFAGNANGNNLLTCVNGLRVKGIGIDGATIPATPTGTAVFTSARFNEDITVANTQGAIFTSGSGNEYRDCFVTNDRGPAAWSIEGTTLNFYNCGASNCVGSGIQWTAGTGGSQSNWFGGLIDECSGFNGTANLANVLLSGNDPIAFWGTTIFSSNNPSVSLVNQIASFYGCRLVPFSGSGAIVIDSASVCNACGSEFAAVNFGGDTTFNFAVNNAGVFNDLGGNTVTDFQLGLVANSFSQSGSIVTIQNSPTPHNLTAANIGQPITVYQVPVGGYNGVFKITAVPSPTSIQYDAGVSGLGTSGGGNFRISSKFGGPWNGTAPVVGLSPSIANFSLAAIASVTFGKWTPNKDIQISRIEINSTVSTTSSVAPVLTITNGNVTKTVSLASGQSYWDSGAIGNIFFPAGLPITVSITQGTSTTAPANLNVTVTYSSIGTP